MSSNKEINNNVETVTPKKPKKKFKPLLLAGYIFALFLIGFMLFIIIDRPSKNSYVILKNKAITALVLDKDGKVDSLSPLNEEAISLSVNYEPSVKGENLNKALELILKAYRDTFLLGTEDIVELEYLTNNTAREKELKMELEAFKTNLVNLKLTSYPEQNKRKPDSLLYMRKEANKRLKNFSLLLKYYGAEHDTLQNKLNDYTNTDDFVSTLSYRERLTEMRSTYSSAVKEFNKKSWAKFKEKHSLPDTLNSKEALDNHFTGEIAKLNEEYFTYCFYRKLKEKSTINSFDYTLLVENESVKSTLDKLMLLKEVYSKKETKPSVKTYFKELLSSLFEALEKNLDPDLKAFLLFGSKDFGELMEFKEQIK